jgi:hypothetical protein
MSRCHTPPLGHAGFDSLAVGDEIPCDGTVYRVEGKSERPRQGARIHREVFVSYVFEGRWIRKPRPLIRQMDHEKLACARTRQRRALNTDPPA